MASLSHVERVWRRVQHLVQIGRTTTAPVDSGNIQTVQIKTSDAAIRDAVPITYHYGFSALIPISTDVTVLNVSGDNSNGVIVGTAHQPSRPKNLGSGQVVLYDESGAQVLLTNGQAVRLNAASVRSTGNATVGTGATGSFTTALGQTVTVRDGIITLIK